MATLAKWISWNCYRKGLAANMRKNLNVYTIHTFKFVRKFEPDTFKWEVDLNIIMISPTERKIKTVKVTVTENN